MWRRTFGPRRFVYSTVATTLASAFDVFCGREKPSVIEFGVFYNGKLTNVALTNLLSVPLQLCIKK